MGSILTFEPAYYSGNDISDRGPVAGLEHISGVRSRGCISATWPTLARFPALLAFMAMPLIRNPLLALTVNKLARKPWHCIRGPLIVGIAQNQGQGAVRSAMSRYAQGGEQQHFEEYRDALDGASGTFSVTREGGESGTS